MATFIISTIEKMYCRNFVEVLCNFVSIFQAFHFSVFGFPALLEHLAFQNCPKFFDWSTLRDISWVLIFLFKIHIILNMKVIHVICLMWSHQAYIFHIIFFPKKESIFFETFLAFSQLWNSPFLLLYWNRMGARNPLHHVKID